MPLTGYLKIPDIPGESQRADHEDEIDIFGLAWDIEQAAMPTRRGRARSRVQTGPLVLHKYYDASSVYLADALRRGKSFDEVVLSVRKDSGEAHLDYLVITMENVVITSYRLGNEPPDAKTSLIAEEIELTFESAKIKYTVQADDHSAGDEHEIEYDVVP